ncbi:hypothetical protein GCM10010495_69410 [Kitasatospora herbaricolor]|uniref:transporter substrate-binding domain-containing protein n=1 Tax=Kitasatospora herbaricolor TaxID=68217 RepID=UPI00174E0436|nr:transporter substrate-binding domain-containing protein [Kitasatospora herbaricolor]MDQ0313344.1 glutamate transport system substrate-binding protein [Kitasatospora herbaricolor]GGV41909.1 hypothetical protein GCM10010495_69410 [Kitasatospora herbaricolor]
MNRHRIGLCMILAAVLPLVSCHGDTPSPSDPTGAAAASQSPAVLNSEAAPEPSRPPGSLPLFGSTKRVHIYIGMKNDQPGWTQTAGYKAAGFDNSVADFLGKEKELNFSFDRVDVPSGDRDSKLVNLDVQFVIATYSMTDDRRKLVDFLGPYMETPQAILVRADSKIKTMADINGSTRLCTAKGGLSASAKPTVGTVVLEDDYSDCAKKLLDGNYDAMFTDTLILYGYADQSNGKLEVRPDINLDGPTEYGIGLPKDSLKDPVNCARMFTALHDFLLDGWEAAFRGSLPVAVQKNPTFIQNYRPDPQRVIPEKNCPKQG